MSNDSFWTRNKKNSSKISNTAEDPQKNEGVKQIRQTSDMVNDIWTLSWRRPLSYRNQSIDLLRKSMGWFLYDIDLRHESVKQQFPTFTDYDICDILFNCLKNA